MKFGDIVELTEDMTFYKKGKKAHYVKNDNNEMCQIVWFGEEEDYNMFGDVEIVPIKMLKLSDSIAEQIEAISFDRNNSNIEFSCKYYQGKPLSNIR